MKSSEDTNATCLVLFIVSPLMAVLNGFVLFAYWDWFITPLFGVKVPAIAYCIGLTLLVRFIVPSGSMDKPKKEYREDWDMAQSIILGVAYCFMTLACGAIVRQFV